MDLEKDWKLRLLSRALYSYECFVIMAFGCMMYNLGLSKSVGERAFIG